MDTNKGVRKSNRHAYLMGSGNLHFFQDKNGPINKDLLSRRGWEMSSVISGNFFL